MEQIIKKIVITGGPCAGKTTAMGWIKEAFTDHDYTVLFVPETATELITGGVAPWTCGTNADYQKCQMRLQLEKEKVFLKAAATMKAEKVLIVCDRGALDNKAYMSDLEFAQVLEDMGLSEVELRDGYDADLVLFDFDRLRDTATYSNPNSLTEGIDAVFVNGQIVYQNKDLTGCYSGRMLRHNA